MASWKKLLVQMLHDPDPRNYAYDDAARVLGNLGFELALTGGGTSHRRWRFRSEDGSLLVVVGLVERGSGPLKPVYIREMVAQLRAAGLVGAYLKTTEARALEQDGDRHSAECADVEPTRSSPAAPEAPST